MADNHFFGLNSALYYAAGISAIPIYPKMKRPCINAWSSFCTALPEPHVQQEFRERFGNGGIGVAAGPASGVVFIDVDSDEGSELAVLESLLPPSPFRKVGKKGYTLAYAFNGEKPFKIKDSKGRMIVELLSTGNQTIVEGIHPDTDQPYTCNTPLYLVKDQLPPLPRMFEEALRGALKMSGVELSLVGSTKTTNWVSAGSRDTKMIAVAGNMARGVLKGEIGLARAFMDMRGWYEAYTEKVVGDELDIDKGLNKIVEFLRKDIENKQMVLPPGWDEGLEEEDKERYGLNFGEEALDWDIGKIRRYLMEIYAEYGPESQERADAVEQVIAKMARSKQLAKKPLDQERILKWIAQSSQLKLSYAALNKQLTMVRNDGIKGGNHTEIAMAVLDRLEETGPLKYAKNRFWRYTGAHWEHMQNSEILEMIAVEFGTLPGALKSHDHNGILRVMMSMRSRDLDEVGIYGVNFANGYLTGDGDFVPHDPKYGCVYVLPFRYLPEEGDKCYKWLSFLERAWATDPDKEQKIMALQEAFCAALLGMGPRLQRVILLKGPGGSGKSQVLKVLQGLFPDEVVSSTPPQVWHDKFSITQLATSMLNICGELSENRRIAGNLFKEVVDGSPQDGQYKGQDIFKFSCKALHVFASNFNPKSGDTSDGFTRRWLILLFNIVVPKEEKQLDFGDMIVAEEREQIAAWAMQARTRLIMNNDYTLPASHFDALEKMATMNDSVRYFFRKGRKIKWVQPGGSSGLISASRLYSEYSMFCNIQAAAKPVSLQTFQDRINQLQSVFGYRIVSKEDANGLEETWLDGCIIVQNIAD